MQHQNTFKSLDFKITYLIKSDSTTQGNKFKVVDKLP